MTIPTQRSRLTFAFYSIIVLTATFVTVASIQYADQVLASTPKPSIPSTPAIDSVLSVPGLPLLPAVEPEGCVCDGGGNGRNKYCGCKTFELESGRKYFHTPDGITKAGCIDLKEDADFRQDFNVDLCFSAGADNNKNNEQGDLIFL